MCGRTSSDRSAFCLKGRSPPRIILTNAPPSQPAGGRSSCSFLGRVPWSSCLIMRPDAAFDASRWNSTTSVRVNRRPGSPKNAWIITLGSCRPQLDLRAYSRERLLLVMTDQRGETETTRTGCNSPCGKFLVRSLGILDNPGQHPLSEI